MNAKTLLFLLLCSTALLSRAQSPAVVISTVYGGGNTASGATFRNDFVELKNRTNTPFVLTGYSLQYGSATGNFTTSYAFPVGTSIPANGYFTVKLGSTGVSGADFTADQTYATMNLSTSAGKVALVNTISPLGCGITGSTCPLPHANIVDLVAYGTANNGEGGTTASGGLAMNGFQAVSRQNNGCTDNNNNSTDFTLVTNPAAPRTAISGTTAVCSTLPVTITSLGAKRKNGGVEISWMVAMEENITAYVVERSLPGSHPWTGIGTVAASGSAAYRFLDGAPLTGTALYRLQVVERSGAPAFSVVVVVKGTDPAFSLRLSPNPTKDRAWLHTESGGRQAVVVRILDGNGRQVRELNGSLSAGMPFPLDLSGLSRGYYFVQVQSKGATATQKLVVGE